MGSLSDLRYRKKRKSDFRRICPRGIIGITIALYRLALLQFARQPLTFVSVAFSYFHIIVRKNIALYVRSDPNRKSSYRKFWDTIQYLVHILLVPRGVHYPMAGNIHQKW